METIPDEIGGPLLAEKVRSIRNSASLSQTEFGKKVGLSQQAVSKIERGETYQSRKLVNIARFAGLTLGELLTENPSQQEYFTTKKRVPRLSWSEARKWEETMKRNQGRFTAWEIATTEVSDNAFAIEMRGDSMISPVDPQSIPSGALLIIDPDLTPTDGDTVVASIASSQSITVKRFTTDGPHRYLKALNQQYNSIVLADEDSIVGVVVEMRLVFTRGGDNHGAD